MMNEAGSANTELSTQLEHIRSHRLGISMNQRIKAEDEIDRLVLDHIERAPIVHVVPQVVQMTEARATRGDAGRHEVNQGQTSGLGLEELRPTATTRCDLENVTSRNKP